MAEVRSSSTPRIAGLDGLRAFAVTAVIAYHLFPSIFPGGYIGVDIFFVISGFLITTLLLREHQKTGHISLKAFWQRRARRLLPALLLVTTVCSSIALFIGGDILVSLGRQVFGAVTFSSNWVEIIHGSDYFNATSLQLFTNFWSLAVEEQFYVLWPFVVLGLVGTAFLKKQTYAGIVLAGSLALASAVWMAVAFSLTNATRVYYGTDTHLFGLMIGALLAFWEYARTKDVPIRRLKGHVLFAATFGGYKFPWQGVGWLAVLGLAALIINMSEHEALSYQGGLQLACVLSALLIIATVNHRGVLQRLLTLKPLEWIGVRSYGLYLWHWPIIILLQSSQLKLSAQATAATVVVATVIAAAISYRFIEEPIRKRGLRATLRRAIRRQPLIISNANMQWRVRPHPMLFAGLTLFGLTATAIITAPQQTQAEATIKHGQTVIDQQRERPVATRAVDAPAQQVQTPVPAPPPPAALPPPITGNDMTVIGDSVALASAPALFARFPGIIVDAKISRSLRVGGFEDIAALKAAGNLRSVVVIALGTNGYYGTGNLDTLMAELGDRQVIFVTSHGPNEWDKANNQSLRAAVSNYPNMHIADWDAAISPHPELLNTDGIHPLPAGGNVYADCIAGVIAGLHS